MRLTIRGIRILLALTQAIAFSQCLASDQPSWGHIPSRNMVSRERNLPDRFDLQTRQHIKWIADLGTDSHSTPVVSGGRVFIGTNNGNPRDPKHEGDRGVLMCFKELDGSFLWQLVVPKLDEDPYLDWPKTGIASPATVEGDRVYIVSNRGEVICLDAKGMSNGNQGPYQDEARHMTPRGRNMLEVGPFDADILWIFDMVAQAGIWTHDGAHSSILIDGDFLYVNTGTGVDNTHRKIRTPDAPSLIVLDKQTGRYLARDQERIAPNIFHCTWSAPSIGKLGDKKAVFFAGGNGMVYAFEPLKNSSTAPQEVASLRRLWMFDFDPEGPKEDVHRFNSNRREGPSTIYGMPVFFEDSLFIAGGGDVWWGKNAAWLKRVDVGSSGSVASSAQVPKWSYPLERHTLSTPAVYNGLVFIADAGRMIHCVDAATGKPHWTHEAKGDFWGSPMVADNKMYIGSRRGDFWIFAADKSKQLLFTSDLGAPMSGTPTPANGRIYLSTMNRLFAFER